jgi:hypothetical protein
MPEQKEHDKPENLVEHPHPGVHTARSLQEAANSNNSLEGYVAMNELNDEEIARQVEEQEESAGKARKDEKAKD